MEISTALRGGRWHLSLLKPIDVVVIKLQVDGGLPESSVCLKPLLLCEFIVDLQ